MSMKDFEQSGRSRPGPPERVAVSESRLLVAHALRDFRKHRGVSTRAMAARLGVSQPRVIAIEKSEDLTVGTITRYAAALSGHVEIGIIGDEELTEGPR
jgi:transcriptional regulator with XRE-family HTH domain